MSWEARVGTWRQVCGVGTMLELLRNHLGRRRVEIGHRKELATRKLTARMQTECLSVALICNFIQLALRQNKTTREFVAKSGARSNLLAGATSDANCRLARVARTIIAQTCQHDKLALQIQAVCNLLPSSNALTRMLTLMLASNFAQWNMAQAGQCAPL